MSNLLHPALFRRLDRRLDRCLDRRLDRRVHRRLPCRLSVAGLFACLLIQSAAAQTVVRSNGTGSDTGGMLRLAQAFMQAHPNVKVEVQPALGSSGGISALIAGQIELAVSNRPPRDSELARLPMQSTEYARTPVVIAVGRDLGVTALTSTQLAALCAEGAATYPNGQRARPVLRLSDAGATELLKSFSPEVATAVDAASKRRGMLNANTDSEAADLVEHTAGAFALSTLALIDSEKRPLTALAIDRRVPTVANLLDGSYPFYKSLWMVVASNATAQTKLFAGFVQSAPGQAVLRAHGHAPR